MDFEIKTTWDNKEVTHDQHVQIQLTESPEGCLVKVQAPFFDTPAAPTEPAGKPCWKLWEYEVVELFFLNEKEQYLELQFCPHGQYLALMLNGLHNVVEDKLELDFKVNLELFGGTWEGTAVIPKSYLPPSVNRFNAFAMHGTVGDNRAHEALYPATKPHDEIEFHRLEYFQPIDLSAISTSLVSDTPSELWGKYPAPATS